MHTIWGIEMKSFEKWKEKKELFKVALGALALIAVGVVLVLISLQNNAAKEVYTGKSSNSKINSAILKTAEEYAKAFCDRDGDKIVTLYTNKKEALKNINLQMLKNKTYTFGESSPWPWTKEYMMDVKGNQVLISFYAMTSDPHVTIYQDRITLQEKNGTAKIEKESFRTFDDIKSKADFDQAYKHNGKYQYYDYKKRELAGPIMTHMQDRPDLYADYAKADTAAVYILNLAKGTAQINEMNDTLDACSVEYTFSDGSKVSIPMYLYKGEDGSLANGIWLVKNL